MISIPKMEIIGWIMKPVRRLELLLIWYMGMELMDMWRGSLVMMMDIPKMDHEIGGVVVEHVDRGDGGGEDHENRNYA